MNLTYSILHDVNFNIFSWFSKRWLLFRVYDGAGESILQMVD